MAMAVGARASVDASAGERGVKVMVGGIGVKVLSSLTGRAEGGWGQKHRRLMNYGSHCPRWRANCLARRARPAPLPSGFSAPGQPANAAPLRQASVGKGQEWRNPPKRRALTNCVFEGWSPSRPEWPREACGEPKWLRTPIRGPKQSDPRRSAQGGRFPGLDC